MGDRGGGIFSLPYSYSHTHDMSSQAIAHAPWQVSQAFSAPALPPTPSQAPQSLSRLMARWHFFPLYRSSSVTYSYGAVQKKERDGGGTGVELWVGGGWVGRERESDQRMAPQSRI